MIQRFAEVSPVAKARTAGAFYLLCIVLGIAGASLPDGGVALAADLAGTSCYVIVTLLLYDLLAPVNKNVSLLAALFSLAGCAKSILSSLSVPTPHVSSLVFFGLYCLLLAFLIFKSTFLPRFLSVLLAITGLGWLTYLSPALGAHLFVPYLMVTGLVGEGALTLWLLAVGVNGPRWEAQRGAA